MNTIKQLIEKYCPDGVEYKKLGEIARITDYVSNGSFKTIAQNVSYKREKDYAVLIRLADYTNRFDNSKFVYIDKNAYDFLSKSKLKGGEIIMSNVGSCGVAFRCPNLGLPMSLAPNSILIDTDYNDFFYHYLIGTEAQKEIKAISSKSAMPKFNKTSFKKILVPVPPLPVQREIVRILDSFTSLEAELEAELEARRKQYEYYRDQLLSFKHLSGGGRDEVEWKTLGEVGTFKRGKYFQKSDMQDEGIPCIHYGQIYTYYNTYIDKTIKFVSKEVASKSTLIRPQSIIITLTSENIEDVCKPVAWIGNEDVAISGHSVGLETDMDPKYITYYLESSHFFKEKRKKARGAKVIEIKPEELAKIAIPIPPLSTQRRIVSILDCFESLVNDISTGLPAEIAARHQQYEYYRDQLLSFKRKS